MTVPTVAPTGVERFFEDDEIIVSKTDVQGRITYANDVFQRISGFTEAELLGASHNIVRHPDMPRSVFQLLWDTIEDGREIFAYVVNLANNGDHYWVLAHVTPTFDGDGTIVGYHSNRRVPDRGAVEKASELYRQLLLEEERHPNRKQGIEAATALLSDLLASQGIEYDAFAFSL